ncbi:hypothetical protein BO94DRAFT_620372 [Aspergillus sclerotioniger CBS 115572]|uniref:NmrA-like domain-containing protein n=1 Tax=Aspergillus sclerotioniger CBS 115572 TaxID=1450535 RepID=A0A317XE78_9EURO|nr:hypothetical protein BO94DRAFT_620372 [Aspergillus sclerotioniger CBS 115572]PWY96062.1 hypothetical protein BO94DRAFT_620372 [Aspergillus sclerotioniger CBS 115572]
MKVVFQYLQTKQVQGVHVMIGALMETLFSPFFGMYDSTTVSLSYWGTGDEVWESTTYGNAADFVASVALDPTAVGSWVIGSVKQIAQIYEDVYGERPILTKLGSLDDLDGLIQERRQKDPPNVMSYLVLSYNYYCMNGQTAVLPETEKPALFEIRRESFEVFFRQQKKESIPTAIARVGTSLCL